VSEVVGEHPDYRVLRLASFAVTGEVLGVLQKHRHRECSSYPHTVL
jgi:hypothetical protein